MRQPQSIEGHVWLQKYFEGTKQFVLSGFKDHDAIAQAVQSLRFLLEREPGYALEVRQLALQCALGSYKAGFLLDMENLAAIGLASEVMDSAVNVDPTPLSLLLLSLAEAQLDAGQRLTGLDSLERINSRIQKAPNGSLTAYIWARELFLRAELDELGGETVRAQESFSHAAKAAADILKEEPRRREFVENWVVTVFGSKDATIETHLDGLEQIGLVQVEQIYVGALLGALRVLPETSTEYARIIGETRDAITTYGYLRDTSPFFLIGVVSALLPDEARAFGDWLIETQGMAVDTLHARLPMDDLDVSYKEVVEEASTMQETDRERDRNVWQVAMLLGLAGARERNGDIEGARRDYYQAMETAIHGRLALPQAVAAGMWFTFLTKHSGKRVDAAASIFLTTYVWTIKPDPRVFYEPRYRALFDKPIAALIERNLSSDKVQYDEFARCRTSVLLDLLRSQVMPPTGVLEAKRRQRKMRPSDAGLWQASNTISRIVEALQGQREVVALITYGSEQGPIFVVIDGNGLTVDRAGMEFLAAVHELEEAALGMLWRVQAGVSGGAQSQLEGAGQRAFGAFPPRVRAAVGSAATVLIAPDYRMDHDVIPFELLHDGQDFLLTSRVVARFTTLRHLARTLDTHLARPSRQRALVTAAPDVKGYQPLFTAALERDTVRGQLLAAGFDVPEINEERLTVSFFVDRLSYVDVLHIAAHGESKAATEYIVLPNERRIDVEDLQRTPQRSIPFIYLNTCQLGKTRYLGGGQYRGLAFTLSELGAPAVIANTTNILDEVSSELAEAFYEEGIVRPVGTALLEARRRLISSGQNPVLVARVILMGNPWHQLSGLEEEGVGIDPTAELLDAFFYNPDPAVRQQAWQEAQHRLQGTGGTIRMKAGIMLVQSASDAQKAENKQWVKDMDGAIELADALNHNGAQALLRYTKAYLGLERGNPEAIEWLKNAIPYLKSHEYFGDDWSRMLIDARAILRRVEMAEKGLQFVHHGPESEDADESLNAIIDTLLATQREAEEEVGSTILREKEESLEDIAWNAVVIGHPNRFEDVGEASHYADQLVRKLVDRGNIPAAALSFAPAMLVGLLWFLWSSQKLTYLEPELAEGQAGTLVELIKDIAAHWSPPDHEPWYSLIESFLKGIDEVLAYLEDVPYERVHHDIKEKVEDLTREAQEVLAQVHGSYPEALPACAALITGTFAVKNRYSPLQGSVPEDIHEKLTDVVWSLNADNEERFYPYLMRGFEVVRNREPDELTKWRWEQQSNQQ
jgi:CHAT domain